MQGVPRRHCFRRGRCVEDTRVCMAMGGMGERVGGRERRCSPGRRLDARAFAGKVRSAMRYEGQAASGAAYGGFKAPTARVEDLDTQAVQWIAPVAPNAGAKPPVLA